VLLLRADGPVDRAEQLGRVEVELLLLLLLEAEERPERCHAHAEELVEVGRENGEEAEPLGQRHAGVGRLLEHAAVEGQPGELAVEERGRLGHAGGSEGRGAPKPTPPRAPSG